MEIILEIEYWYHGFDTGSVISRMYPTMKGKTLEDCVKKGEAYFAKRVSELGWKKKVDLIQVRQIPNGKEPPAYIVRDDGTIGDNPARKSRTKHKVPKQTRTTRAKNPRAKSRTGNQTKRGKDSGDGGSTGRKGRTTKKGS